MGPVLDLAHRRPPRATSGPRSNGLPVGQQLTQHLLVTLRMVLLATFLAVFVAVPLGVWAAVRKGKPTDHVVNVTNFLLLAIPTFVIGTLLKEFVAIPINQAAGKTIFYTIGEQSPLLSGPFLGRIPDYAAHTVLPGAYPDPRDLSVMGHISALIGPRVPGQRLRPSGEGKGHLPSASPRPPRAAKRLDPRHHRRGPRLRHDHRWGGRHRDDLLAGTEWDNGSFRASIGRDVNIVLAFLIVTATSIILFNLLADILYAFLDPRIRYD